MIYDYQVTVTGLRTARIQANSLEEAQKIVEGHGNEQLFDDEYAIRRFGDGKIEIIADDLVCDTEWIEKR
jgi:hypothetical protein